MPHNTFGQNGRVAGVAAVMVPTGLIRVVVRKTDLSERRASLPIGDRSPQSREWCVVAARSPDSRIEGR
jgi:hypothetical protein